MENTEIFLDTDVIINWIAKEENPNNFLAFLPRLMSQEVL